MNTISTPAQRSGVHRRFAGGARRPSASLVALKTLGGLLLGTILGLPLHAEQDWRAVTLPTLAETAAGFAQPPKEYSAIDWAIWGGRQTKERIIADIDKVYTNGGGVYMINNSRGVEPKYLSPEYLDLVKTAVAECQRHGMKVWIEGDCGYPDGFAGGLISEQYPQLGMQGIVAAQIEAFKAFPPARRWTCRCRRTPWALWPVRAPSLRRRPRRRRTARTIRRLPHRPAGRCRCRRMESLNTTCPGGAAGN